MMEDHLPFHQPNLPSLFILEIFHRKICLPFHSIFHSIPSPALRYKPMPWSNIYLAAVTSRRYCVAAYSANNKMTKVLGSMLAIISFFSVVAISNSMNCEPVTLDLCSNIGKNQLLFDTIVTPTYLP